MNHKELDAWKMGMDLVEETYLITRSFPDHEKYGLINQIRRAAVSIPSNIAEGSARFSDKEFIRFLYIALGSVSELETQLLISLRLKYLKKAEIISKIENVRRPIIGLIKYLRNEE